MAVKQTATQLANLRQRWTRARTEKRPGVEAAGPHRTEDGVRYAAVTRSKRTYHETFDEAAAEYWLRRKVTA